MISAFKGLRAVSASALKIVPFFAVAVVFLCPARVFNGSLQLNLAVAGPTAGPPPNSAGPTANEEDDDDGFKEAFAPLKSNAPEAHDEMIDNPRNENGQGSGSRNRRNAHAFEDPPDDTWIENENNSEDIGKMRSFPGENPIRERQGNSNEGLASDLQGTINAADVDPTCKDCAPYLAFTGDRVEAEILQNFLGPAAVDQPLKLSNEVGAPLRAPSATEVAPKVPHAAATKAAAKAVEEELPPPPGFEK